MVWGFFFPFYLSLPDDTSSLYLTLNYITVTYLGSCLDDCLPRSLVCFFFFLNSNDKIEANLSLSGIILSKCVLFGLQKGSHLFQIGCF